MNSMERALAAIGHKEADRVPLFLLFSYYGARESGMGVKEYFSDPANVLKAQLRMREKYTNDCYYSFFYAPIEIEAFGGEVIFDDEAPPNTGEPFIKSFSQIRYLELPDIKKNKCLKKVLEATSLIKQEAGNEVPIIGVVMSPYSLPVMQLGFEKYLDLIYNRSDEFDMLMRFNEEFTVEWANAQLEAGATAICYFDPLASPNIIEKDRYLITGNPVASRTIARIKGPVATHLASGLTYPVIEDVISTGSCVLGFSSNDDLHSIKKASAGRICLLGNLNGIEMSNWSTDRTEKEVKKLIGMTGAGGGLLVAENHGEVPWSVPEEVLLTVSETVREYGRYPLKVES